MINEKLLTIWSRIDEANLPNGDLHFTVYMKIQSFALVL